MKIVRILLLVVAALAIIVLVLSALSPKDITIERSALIPASREVVYAQISRFENFIKWSPWADLDPNMEQKITGTDGATGAKYEWKGNEQAGAGSMQMTRISPERIEEKLLFTAPFTSEADVYYDLKEEEGGVKVTWGMVSHMPVPMNVMGLFMNMEELMGKDYEKGLVRLAARCAEAESLAPKEQTIDIQEITLTPRTYLGKRQTIPMSEVTAFYAQHLPAILGAMAQKKITPVGAPSGVVYTWDTERQETDMMAAIPAAPGSRLDTYVSVELEGPALRATYYGPYEGTGVAHEALDRYMKEKNLRPANPVIEEYVTDPGVEPDTSKWLTYIIQPLSKQ
jgi:effector-binding domain-containing protein